MQKKIDEFQNRFNKIISIRNMKPVELSEKTGLSKSTISHYMSGYTKPKSDKLYILAKVLSVNEAWLMGFDVPMKRDPYEDQNIITFDAAFDNALNFLESFNYKVSLSDNNNSDVIIKNEKNEILACMHDYELVGRYLAVCENKLLVPEDIINISKPKGDFSFTEYNHIQKYRVLDSHGKEMVDFTLQKEWERSTATKDTEPPSPQMRLINYYYRLASAGTGQIIFDMPPTKRIEIPDLPEYRKADYAIGVNGNSMEPTYYDGDTLLVEMTEEIKVGEIGIFSVNNECFVKKLGHNELISLNPECNNIPLNETAHCMGRVLGKLGSD